LGWGVAAWHGRMIQPPSLSLPHKGEGNAIARPRTIFWVLPAAIAFLLSAIAPTHAQRATQFPPVQAVTAQHGMVVAQESRAALIGAYASHLRSLAALGQTDFETAFHNAAAKADEDDDVSIGEFSRAVLRRFDEHGELQGRLYDVVRGYAREHASPEEQAALERWIADKTGP